MDMRAHDIALRVGGRRGDPLGRPALGRRCVIHLPTCRPAAGDPAGRPYRPAHPGWPRFAMMGAAFARSGRTGAVEREASVTVGSGTSRVPVYTLLIATAISLLGNRLTSVAVPWFVLVTTGSAAKTGLTVFFTTLPLFLSGFFGGALVDRLGFKRTSVLGDLFSGATIALIPLLHYTVGLAFWQLLLLVFLADSLNTPGNTARQGLWPDLIALAGYRLKRVNAARQAPGNLASLLGPPLAGALIAVVGPGRVLWLDAATFLASAV